jgi:hypothetical protein
VDQETINDTMTGIDEDWKERAEALIEKVGDVWRCKSCDKTAEDSRQRYKLKIHVQNHLDGLAHMCKECGYTSQTTRRLDNHMYKKHRELMKSMTSKKMEAFKCSVCGKGSSTKKGIQGHMYKYHKGQHVYNELESNITEVENAPKNELSDDVKSSDEEIEEFTEDGNADIIELTDEVKSTEDEDTMSTDEEIEEITEEPGRI